MTKSKVQGSIALRKADSSYTEDEATTFFLLPDLFTFNETREE